MDISTILKNTQVKKIGRTPVVILSLDAWKKIEDKLEDLEMLQSKTLRKKITKARKEKKIYSSSQVKKLLGI